MQNYIQNEKEAKDAQLARNLRKADLEQVVSMIEADLSLLASHTSTDAKKQEQHALDMKYLRERQQRLDVFVMSSFLFFMLFSK